MGKSHQAGGVYKDASGDGYHDSEGRPVSLKEAKAAVKSAAAAQAPAAASSTPTPPAGGEEQKKGTLPEDFPHRAILEAAGITSYGKLRDADLSTVEGIGPARQAEIEAALKA